MLQEARSCIDGKDMKKVPTKKRKVGMVFQSYALFPNMTVYENVAFGLKMKKKQANEVAKEVEKCWFLLVYKRRKMPTHMSLSGGQQQRVALARALVVRPQSSAAG